MTTAQSQLIQRLRAKLATETSTREVAMFGGRLFMVNEKLVVSALKTGDLLVRIPPDRHDELTALPGVAQAEMGSGRLMGPSWVAVAGVVIETEADLAYWLEIAMEYNRVSG